ncbi:hypothetical protein AB8A21_09660 [Streptomyces sp. BF23-18]|uniref:hypothetical protein n=1 Tax=Streptomyces sp. BF23-18 TaxID=3240282 RepID=UPI0034E59407
MTRTNPDDRFNVSGFRAFCAQLGIDTEVRTTADGLPDVHLDRAGLEKLRDAASEHGAFTIAAAIDIALAKGSKGGRAS